MGSVIPLKKSASSAYLELKNLVGKKLTKVETLIQLKLKSDVNLIEKMTHHHLDSGGKRLRLDLFTKWAFERNGFKLIGKIIERDIINKSQPSKSSNDGKSEGPGEVGETMNKEYIVRLRKIC